MIRREEIRFQLFKVRREPWSTGLREFFSLRFRLGESEILKNGHREDHD
jgi:hypothetical protein